MRAMGSRPGLDRTRVAQAAARVVDEMGVDKLTLSAVAEHLKVRTPSLYNHVDGLPGLRREIALLGLDELNARLQRSALGKSGDEALRSMLIAYRDFAKDRPGVYSFTLQAPTAGDHRLEAASRDIIDTLQTVLTSYSFGAMDVIHVMRGFRAIAHGFVALEAAGGFGMDLDTNDSYERLISLFLRGLHEVISERT